MKLFLSPKIFVFVAVLVAAIAIFTFSTRNPVVDFNSQVKPIFNKKCITCHGGVRRKAGFSLLFRADALANTESGKPAIIPGSPEKSELIRRLSLSDPEERMPYRHEPLKQEEIDVLKRWIRQGAPWGDHWAYVPVKKENTPALHDGWIKNDIDAFVLQRLQSERLKPSPEAPKDVLLRRVSLDLIGMYPPKEIAQRYLASNDESAYSTLVDSLLASPQFGERWASMWLDISRYADTRGYEADMGRNIWRYRDWVIRAFNEDKPYDQFIADQIAGDLMPNPDDAKYIATAFHRNSMSNDEGGTDNEEFRVAAVIDRVNTTWEALMGTTFGCVQCHSHPYDPFRHDEYYNFMAYFNNTRDEDVPAEYPILRQFNDSLHQQLEDLTKWLTENGGNEKAAAFRSLVRTWQPSVNSETSDDFTHAILDNNNSGLSFRNHAIARIKHVDLTNATQLVFRHATYKKGGTLQFRLDRADGPVLVAFQPHYFDKGGRGISFVDFGKREGIHDIYIRYDNPSVKNEDFTMAFEWFAFMPTFPGKGTASYQTYYSMYRGLVAAEVEGTPVMIENPSFLHRSTHVFERGNWLVKGKEVEPAVPQSLRYAMPRNAPPDRRGLAMWLTNKQNPLVARTMVNRVWEQFFGAGIAETLEDLGTQGIPPTHRELLDHLSWKFMNDYGWSVKRLLKEIVMSAAYRQDSKLTEEIKQKDLYNKLYARGPRVRLSSEQLRDEALCISGMVSSKMYGPAVMPWQPPGIWQSPYNSMQWTKSDGEDQYRRALYTFWKRSSPYPSMVAFDNPSRVVCTARRIRTNTPLQSLVTLNDSVYIDLARQFAYRMQREGGTDFRSQISKGYEWMLYRPITPGTLKIFTDLYTTAYSAFEKDPDKTCEMIGEMNAHNNAAAAAMVVVANAMLNLDEVVTKN